MNSRGARVFILDLRDNFGGLLTAGVDVARLFLAEGVVIQEQFRDQEITTYRVEKPGTLMDIPLAVLVNQHTASAAEIIAGALKEHDRAQLIGVPTFGKATIQMIFDLQDGSSLHITAARWWVPDLEPAIAEKGVQPDVYLEPSPDPNGKDALVQEAARLLLGDE